MSPISLILPALTVISLFFYIFSAERAWLPQKGTTEWITRASTPKRMTADIKLDFKWKDIIVFIAVAAVYGAFSFIFTSNIFHTVSMSVFTGIVYILAKLLFKNRITAVFAAAITAADVILLQPSLTGFALLALLAAFACFVLISSSNLFSLLPAGLCLGAAMWIEPESAIFIILPLVLSIVLCVNRKSGKPIVACLLCCLVLPAAIYSGLSYTAYGKILITRIVTSFIPPIAINAQYLAVSAVMLIMLVIHIFKDKSVNALFISIGLVLCGVGMYTRLNLVSLFAGLAAAYFADIIIKRGGKSHRVFCIIFGIVMLLPLLLSVFYPGLSANSTYITYIS